MANKNNPRKSVRTPKINDKRGTNPNSLANLAPPWKAGAPSPNPSGKPKLLGESYKAMLARVNEQDPQKRTNAELIAEALKLEAMKGDVGAAKEIRSATEGDSLNLAVLALDHIDITIHTENDSEDRTLSNSDSDGTES